MNSNRQTEVFAAFIKVLADKYKPLYIYRFGKFIESNSKSGCFVDDTADENQRYHLLMIIESVTRIEHAVQDYCTHHFDHGSITILVHAKETFTASLKANNRFFITVANSGELLYSHDQTVKSFQVPDFIPTKAAEKATRHHLRCISQASGFLECAMLCLRSRRFHLCLFMLHQTIEQCCIGMIRVHLAYRSDMHNLYRLLRLCDSFSPAMSGLFLEESEEGRRLFKLMVDSYSAGRYNDNFIISQADAEKLYNQVQAFLKMTDVLCLDKIEALSHKAAAYKQAKSESEAAHG